MTGRVEASAVSSESAENEAVQDRVFVGRRAYYLDALQETIELARCKQRTRSIKDRNKAMWSRILINACSSAGAIYRDSSLEDLDMRLKRLEAVKRV